MSSFSKYANIVETIDPINNFGFIAFQADSAYSTVQSNSATWGIGGSSVDLQVRSLTGNWQSTYSTVQTNSATWNSNIDTGVRTLTGNWQSTYSTVQTNSATWGGGSSSGKVKQIVAAQTYNRVATTAFFPLDNTIPQNTEGAAISALDVTITPSSSANKIAIYVNLHLAASQAVGYMAALFVNGTANAISMDWGVNNNAAWPYKLSWNAIVDAASTSSRTYQVRFGQTSNTGHTLALNYYNGTYWGDKLISSVVAIEYEP